MSDFNEKNKIVQANNLIQQSNNLLNQNELKLFKLLVSCIDTNNPPKDNIVTITKNELISFLDLGENYNYLQRQLRNLITGVKLIDDKENIVFIPLVRKVHWKKDIDEVSVQFEDEIMPYLIDLNGLFLQYDVTNLQKLKSKYALILYEYLLSRERQERLSEHRYTVSISKLRLLTSTINKYTKFKDFELKVLQKAKNEINNTNLEFLVDYEKIKVGRTIKQIDFILRKRTSIQENNFDIVVRPEWILNNI